MSNDFTNSPVYGVNVCEMGAKGDGKVDDAPAIQRALDAGRGLVAVPAGRYLIGRTLRVPSRTRLVVHERATLVLADGAGRDDQSFLLANRGYGDSEIEVSGGVWNGNCLKNPRGADEPGVYTGAIANFIGVRGLVLRNMTFVDAEAYYLRLGEASDFLVEGITFEVNHLRPNQDGVHLGGFCEDGIIRRIRGVGQGATSDDIVALNADDGCHRAQNLGLKCGPIRRIVVQDIAATDCHTFVRLLSAASDIDEIDISNVRGGCRVSMLNADACRHCRVPAYDPTDPAFARGVGRIGRVRISDVEVYKSHCGNRSPLIDIESDAGDLELTNFRRDAARDASSGALTLLADDVSTRQMVLEGLSAEQVQAMRHEKLQGATIAPEARADAQTTFRFATTLTRASHLELPAGGFDRLAIKGELRQGK